MSHRPLPRLFLGLLACLAFVGCSATEDSETQTRGQAFYAIDNARVFGFEDPVNDWGGVFKTDTVKTQGEAAARVVVPASGNIQFGTVIPISGLGNVGDVLSIDFNPPSVQSWSALRIVLRSGDAQLWYGDLGTLSMADILPGQFTTLQFTDLSRWQSQLNVAEYNDLTVEILVVGPAGDYYFDNLVFGGDAAFSDDTQSSTGGSNGNGSGIGGVPNGVGGTGTTGTGSDSSSGASGPGGGSNRMVIRVPVSTTFNEVIFGGQSKGLDVHDAVQAVSGARNPNLGTPEQNLATVTSVGNTGTIIGSGTWVGDVISVPNVTLRSGARAKGNVVTEGSYDQQLGAQYTGSLQEGANLEPFEETTFEYEFPHELQEVGFIQNGVDVSLPPGGYGATTVQGTGTNLRLAGPGAFYFDELKIDSGTTWQIDNTQGAVFVVVRGKLRLRGQQTNLSPEKRNILFAVEGEVEPDLGKSFRGVLLAPNATVHIPSVDLLQGAFFADEIIVHQNTNFELFPFSRDDCSTACGLMFGCPGEPPLKGCPGTVGGDCLGDEDCAEGLSCGVDNGGHFGRSRVVDLCWDATLCGSSAIASNCGDSGEPCGLCSAPTLTCAVDDDCPTGEVCGTNNGIRFGSEEPNVCEPSFCTEGASLSDGSCGATWRHCGLCECTPNCSEKVCGDDTADGCGGICVGLCAGGVEGCSSSLDCGLGEICLATADGQSTTCRNAACAQVDPASSECNSGFNACGEPCECDIFCQAARGTRVTASLVRAEDLPQAVGEVSGELTVSPSGMAGYTIPLELPPGVAGLAPSLSVSYDSSAGDGPLGPQWTLNGFSQIYRCPKTLATDGKPEPIRFQDDPETGVCMDGERLIFVGHDGPRYRWRTEKESFRDIISEPADDVSGSLGKFTVRTKNGIIYRYGSTVWSSIYGPDRSEVDGDAPPGNLKRVWALDRVEDLNGNWIDYSYVLHASIDDPDLPRVSMVPATIAYSPGDRRVEFKYEERNDSEPNTLPLITRYVAGMWTRSYSRLRSIDILVQETTRRRYRLDYGEVDNPYQGDVRPWSKLESFSECALQGGEERCKSPTKFEYAHTSYSSVSLGEEFNSAGSDRANLWVVLDANGDGADDLLGSEGLYLSVIDGPAGTDHRFRHVPLDFTIPEPKDKGQVGCFGAHGVVDLDGDGAQEIVDTCGATTGDDSVQWEGTIYRYVRTEDDEGNVEESMKADGQLTVPIEIKILAGIHFPGGLNFPGGVKLPGFGKATNSWARFYDVNGDSWQDLILVGHEIPSSLYKAEFFSAGIHLYDPETQTFQQGLYHSEEKQDKFGDISPSSLEFFDIDGDGVLDIVQHPAPGCEECAGKLWQYLHLETGQWKNTNIGISMGNENLGAGEEVSTHDAIFRFGDWNADGLMDLLSFAEGVSGATDDEVVAWFSTGNGQFVARRQEAIWSKREFQSALVRPGVLGAQLMLPRQVTWGSGYVWDTAWFQNEKLVLKLTTTSDAGPYAPFSIAGDYDGDGSIDVFIQDESRTWGPTQYPGLQFTNWNEDGLLYAVETGFGRRSVLSYGDFKAKPRREGAYAIDENCSAGSLEYACQTGQLPMVSRVREFERGSDERLRGVSSAEYHYTNIRHGRGGRGSYGPETFTIEEFDNEENFVGRTERTFNNTNWVTAGTLATEVAKSSWLTNAANRPTFRNGHDVENVWKVVESDEGRPYPQLDNSVETSIVYTLEISSVAHAVVSAKSAYEYDEFGNVKKLVKTTHLPPASGSNWTESLTAQYHYAHEEDDAFREHWLLGLVTNASVDLRRKLPPNGFLTQAAREESWTYSPSTGLPLTATREGNADLRLTTVFAHDPHGNLVQSERSAVVNGVEETRTSRRFFDSRGLFPVLLHNEMGHSTEPSFDELTGALRHVRDANGLETTLTYDAFGRPTGKVDWQDTTTIAYQKPPIGRFGHNELVDTVSWAKLRVSTTVDGGGTETTDLDAFGRPVLRRSSGLGGADVSQTTAYDWRGNVIRESRAHAGISKAPGVNEYIYDIWGRLVREEFADGTRRLHGYLPRVPDTESDPWFSHGDALSAEWVSPRIEGESTNAREVVRSFDLNGALVASRNAEGVATNFYYGPFGVLLKTEHVEGAPGASNWTNAKYDGWGRLKSLDDPDIGHLEYDLDGFDQVGEVRDPRGLITRLEYDSLGRTMRQFDSWPAQGNEAAREEQTTWKYDTAPGGVGRLARTESPDGVVQDLAYYTVADSGQSGLVKSVSLRVDNEQYVSSFTYDEHKRLQTVIYPAVDGKGYEALNTYDSDGFLVRVDGISGGVPRPIWEFSDAHEGQLIEKVQLGGVTTRTTNYEDLTSRVLGIAAQTSAAPVQDLSYGYFKNGDLKWRENAMNTSEGKETFTYDSLHRLKSSQLTRNNENVSETYGYDVLGNLTTKGGATYGYGNEAAGPHAVTSAGENTYGYDAVGNQITREGPWVAGGEQEVHYNAFNLPRSIRTGPEGVAGETTEFHYTAGGQRVLKRSDVHESVLFGGLYERVKSFGSHLEVTHKYLVYANGEMVAQVSRKKDSNNEWKDETAFFLTDALGSVATILDEEGSISHSQEFEPFGQSRNAQFTDPGVRYGFTGHAHDEFSGLIDMGGRIYDPQLGRFLSADPIVQSPANLQSHNRYSYVWNNPLGMVDPSGFSGSPVNGQGMSGGGCTGSCSAAPGGGSGYTAVQPGAGGYAHGYPGLFTNGSYQTMSGPTTASGPLMWAADGETVTAISFVTGEPTATLEWQGGDAKMWVVVGPAVGAEAGVTPVAARPSAPTGKQATPSGAATGGPALAGGGALGGGLTHGGAGPASGAPTQGGYGASGGAFGGIGDLGSMHTAGPSGGGGWAAAGALLGGYVGLGVGAGVGALAGAGVLSAGTIPAGAWAGAAAIGFAGYLAGSALDTIIVWAAKGAGREATGLVAQNGTKVTGYTKHGLNRAIGDGGKRAGTKASSIRDALQNPKSIKSGVDDAGRPFEAFKGNSARVVVNPETGQIVSVNPIGRAGVR